MNQNQLPLGYQQITDLSAAVALTVPAGTGRCVIIPETQAVRFRDDGTDPTSTVGMPLPVNVPYTYIGSPTRLKFIQQTASAALNIAYYG